jgi:NADP-dependent 3-hydroxy acid dehydrogenase YdfG|tara:strand:- start:49 stop:576 length:528 start_codon:yes stop_codon:yes gene_type:complete
VIITGTYGLAKYLGDYFIADNISAKNLLHSLDTTTIGTQLRYADASIFINCEHNGSQQVRLFDKFFKLWKSSKDKYIINISSRAAQPNISKGFLYASEKAALNHYTNNTVYNSEKVCRVTTLNLGLMAHKILPSVSYQEVLDTIDWLIKSPMEIPEITIQHRANYQQVQYDKSHL